MHALLLVRWKDDDICFLLFLLIYFSETNEERIVPEPLLIIGLLLILWSYDGMLAGLIGGPMGALKEDAMCLVLKRSTF